MKSNESGVRRLEFEYPIPAADAETMLSQLGADGLRLEKTRYLLRHEGHEWSVDVFGAALAGLVLAEIELADPDEAFAKPDWLGAEVTHDLRYRNAALAEHGLP
jgi:adenylate cyclase